MSLAKRIVVKVGTNVLTKSDGTLDKPIFHQLVVQLVKSIENGWHPILVSSGAVGAGRSILKDYNIADEAVQRQVLSSVGQATLMKRYYELFSEYDIICAQVLATKEDFAEGDHYQNMINCFEGLLAEGIVPIVNENDVVSLSELMFTDNDELAGLTAKMIKANKLLILSNVEGVYSGNPETEGAALIKEINVSDHSNWKIDFNHTSSAGRGGMQSKFGVAIKCSKAGIETSIAHGKKENVITKILEGDNQGTLFYKNSQERKEI